MFTRAFIAAVRAPVIAASSRLQIFQCVAKSITTLPHTNPTNMSASKAKVISRSPLAADEAKWTRLVKVVWQDPHGKERIWESAERPTRSKTTGVDAVGICAILEKPNGPEILLQKQFRPAVDKVCIEVPAGLIDEGESVETSAVRELKEETGYVGEVIKGGLAITPCMFNGMLVATVLSNSGIGRMMDD